MSSTTEKRPANIQGIRISNLDSTDQAETWRKLVSRLSHGSDSAFFWDASSHACELEIHNNTDLVQYFAQCLRTAYLTNKRITLTYQEVLDGTFFLAFGPENINKILGLSPKDEPALYIRTYSDKHKTLKDALLDSFTTHNAADVYSIDPTFEHGCLTACPGLIKKTICQPEPTPLPYGFEKQNDYIDILEHALETSYHLKKGQLSFLAQRWKEWVDAADSGVIRFVPKDCSVGAFDFRANYDRVKPFLDNFLNKTKMYEDTKKGFPTHWCKLIAVKLLLYSKKLLRTTTTRNAPKSILLRGICTSIFIR